VHRLVGRTPRNTAPGVSNRFRRVYRASLPLCLVVAAILVAAAFGADDLVPFLSRSGTAGDAVILVVTVLAAPIAQLLEARHARDAP
jgi:hypothetical protein